MKKALLFFLFFGTIISSKAQILSGEIQFRLKGNDQAFTERYEKNPASEAHKGFSKYWYNKQKRAIPFLDYRLTFNKTESLFKNKFKMMKNDNGMDLRVAAQVAGTAGEFYTDIRKGEILNDLYYIGRDWLILHDVNKLKWEITNDSKTILGYNCKKATAEFHPIMSIGGEITAWFTPEIPFQFGPTTFAGLPGMVLEVEQGNYIFYATDIQLYETQMKIEKPKGKPQPVEEFQKERRAIENRFKGGR